jgi:hypothetical protein
MILVISVPHTDTILMPMALTPQPPPSRACSIKIGFQAINQASLEPGWIGEVGRLEKWEDCWGYGVLKLQSMCVGRD